MQAAMLVEGRFARPHRVARLTGPGAVHTALACGHQPPLRGAQQRLVGAVEPVVPVMGKLCFEHLGRALGNAYKAPGGQCLKQRRQALRAGEDRVVSHGQVIGAAQLCERRAVVGLPEH